MHIFVRDKTFYQTVCQTAFPVVLQCLITAGVNMMDTLMLTSCGEIPLSAASLANQFISLYQTMCMGLGVGAAVLTAQFWGKGDCAGIRGVITLMLRVCSAFALLFSVISFFFPAQIMGIYTPDSVTNKCGGNCTV